MPDGIVGAAMGARESEEPSLGHAVELRHISKRYGRVEAVRDVSLDIRENEFFSLLGPSGCGKTTILRMISGFERPTAGEIFLKQRRANDIPPYRRDTNLIFQHLALFPHLDVYDNIAFGLRLKRLDRGPIRQKVHRILDLVDLGGFGTRRVHQLSGGQKQRVAIARALVNEPAVLLLDEPLGALDLRLRVQMQVELKEIQHRVGTTFIYVTHDQTEALTMSDRIAVMHDGTVEQVGTGREVYELPRTRFVATFLGESNLFEGQVEERAQDHTTVSASGQAFVAPPNTAAAPGTTVYVCVRPERVRVVAAAESQSDLDACENRYPARVRDITFKGAFIEYRLLTPFDQPMMVQVHSDGRRLMERGESIIVAWRRHDCVVLTA
ncbi:MAG TPA: ABC transporter ATP-binding protein [bacterium]|nr:ABC transporter ATP-binding protein [bacterium]